MKESHATMTSMAVIEPIPFVNSFSLPAGVEREESSWINALIPGVGLSLLFMVVVFLSFSLIRHLRKAYKKRARSLMIWGLRRGYRMSVVGPGHFEMKVGKYIYYSNQYETMVPYDVVFFNLNKLFRHSFVFPFSSKHWFSGQVLQ